MYWYCYGCVYLNLNVSPFQLIFVIITDLLLLLLQSWGQWQSCWRTTAGWHSCPHLCMRSSWDTWKSKYILAPTSSQFRGYDLPIFFLHLHDLGRQLIFCENWGGRTNVDNCKLINQLCSFFVCKHLLFLCTCLYTSVSRTAQSDSHNMFVLFHI